MNLTKLKGELEGSAQQEPNMQDVSPEYRMAYFNNILLYAILRALSSEQMAKEIWEEARKQAFPQLEEEKDREQAVL